VKFHAKMQRFSMTIPRTQNPKPKTQPLGDLDRAILNEIQSHFPIESRPYAEVGRRVGAPEEEVLARVAAMAEAGIIRRLGANFTSRKLGYTSTLCAAHVPEDLLPGFVEVVNRYPGVTHNYLRRHRFNVWFTLIAESAARLNEILAEISQASGVADILSLPAQEVFKIKVDFPL
jgi:siroheme decarboxylase